MPTLRPDRATSVATLDLTTGATLATDADSQYRAASVNKLELLIDIYRRAAMHQIDLDATTVIQADDIQNYGTGTIQLGGPGQVFTWRALAKLMAQESDNTASYVVGGAWVWTACRPTSRLGADADIADRQSHLGPRRRVTAVEAGARQFAQRWRPPRCARPAAAHGLDRSTAVRRASWLPVAHKIGTDIGVYNDAALFLDAQRPYVAVVLSGSTGESDALITMTHISQSVYQFEGGLPAASRPLR